MLNKKRKRIKESKIIRNDLVLFKKITRYNVKYSF